jgi:glucan 1,3-beta-glucosidase
MQHNKYRKHTRLLKTVSTLFLTAALSACGGGGSDDDEVSLPIEIELPQPPAELSRPASGQESYSMLHQEDTHWVNEEQQSVSLRGINLGNWLSIETWMFGGNESLGEGIVDQCTLEEKLVERFGAEEKDNIMTSFRDGWLTEKDWDKFSEAGFNLVRLPFFL